MFAFPTWLKDDALYKDILAIDSETARVLRTGIQMKVKK